MWLSEVYRFPHTTYPYSSCICSFLRIRTIRGFCCANLGSELLRNNPRIAHANLGSEDLLRKPRIRTQSSGIAQPNLGHLRQQTHDRSRMQSNFSLRKPRIHTQSSGIAQPNFGHPRQQTHDRSRTQSSSAIRVIEATIDHTRKAVRPSAAKKPQSIAHAKQLGHPLQRTHVAADGRAALRARSIVGLLPRMAEVWLRDPRRLRADPRFACAILGLLRKSRIRGLRSKILGWSESVLCA